MCTTRHGVHLQFAGAALLTNTANPLGNRVRQDPEKREKLQWGTDRAAAHSKHEHRVSHAELSMISIAGEGESASTTVCPPRKFWLVISRPRQSFGDTWPACLLLYPLDLLSAAKEREWETHKVFDGIFDRRLLSATHEQMTVT